MCRHLDKTFIFPTTRHNWDHSAGTRWRYQAFQAVWGDWWDRGRGSGEGPHPLGYRVVAPSYFGVELTGPLLLQWCISVFQVEPANGLSWEPWPRSPSSSPTATDSPSPAEVFISLPWGLLLARPSLGPALMLRQLRVLCSLIPLGESSPSSSTLLHSLFLAFLFICHFIQSLRRDTPALLVPSTCSSLSSGTSKCFQAIWERPGSSETLRPGGLSYWKSSFWPQLSASYIRKVHEIHLSISLFIYLSINTFSRS